MHGKSRNAAHDFRGTDKEYRWSKNERWKAISNATMPSTWSGKKRVSRARVCGKEKSRNVSGFLTRKVTRKRLLALLAQGIEPETGEVLRPRERHTLTRNGKVYARPIALYDADFAPGKSVSIVGMIDPRIEQAQRETVRELAPSIESLAMVRRDRQLHPARRERSMPLGITRPRGL
jgi:hypothetical protein